jgi:tol-pal system protein YbgF
MRRPIVLALAALATGCFYPADRGRALEVRLERLAADNQHLEEELTKSRERLTEALTKLSTAVESLEKGARRSDADIGVQLQKNIEDVAALRGQVETYQYRVTELENLLKRASDDLERRAIADKGADAVKEAEAKKKAEELKRPDEPREYLKLADEKAKAGDLPLARQLYNDFLKKWPRDPSAGDAHFGLGETYFTDDKCREALYEYGKVIQDFTASKAVPQALLRSADCFKKLKMVAESKLALEEVVTKHPRSDAAKSAKVKLAELAKDDKAAPKKKGK